MLTASGAELTLLCKPPQQQVFSHSRTPGHRAAHLLQSFREGKCSGMQGLRGVQASQAALQLTP